LELRDRLAQYRIIGQLGRGGMGVVYEAFDERLERKVALKLIGPDVLDATARKRFWREARTAAAVSHPNVCQVFDVGDHEGDLFLAMELLEGETLARRLTAGPLPVRETIEITLGVLAALQALHDKNLVHRDVKPGNLFLTPHGVKLLDFGLTTQSSEMPTAAFASATEPLTMPGLLIGTPCYMAPEQVRGEAASPATDLFAVGALMFEMLTGRRAFDGASPIEVLRAVEIANPPALTGSPLLAAVDRILHVALAKKPSERYPSASVMARGLRTALQMESEPASRSGPEVSEVRRLIVLPFRPLRTDPDSDFLAISLPDAITHSLAGLQSLVVRSSLVSAKYADGVPDVQRLAVEADVDLVLAGTLLKAGNNLQVTVQLFQTPSGTLLKSHIARVAWGDIFELQSEVVHQVVEALGLRLTTKERESLERDTPANPAAYELYLRANEAASRTDRIAEAISLYEECVRLDPGFAPALARLGRCYRYQGKYGARQDDLRHAESLLASALGTNSELGLAHSLLAQLETDRGQAQIALARLLERLQRTPNSPDLYAGLVYACRFCGLLDASIAAHLQAHRFSSRVPTSVAQTYFAMGNYERCLETYHDDLGYVGALALQCLGRTDDAVALVTERERWRQTPLGLSLLQMLRALIEGRREDCVRLTDEARERFHLRGEELFYVARHYAWADEQEKALGAFAEVVETGYFNYPTLATDPWLVRLRGHSAFEETLRKAEERHRAAESIFLEAGGSRYLS
jgi:serine/threonine protein kinase/tetratricopeptide (TPR) repeat protein